MPSWSYSAITTLVTPAGTITFGTGTDYLFIDPAASTGLGVSQIRTSIFNKGQTDGYNILPSFEEGQHLVLGGRVIITSSATEAGIVTARDTLLTATRTKLKSILQVSGTLNFSTGDIITVFCETLIAPADVWVKTFVFSLVSANPA